jgi:uncharacterized protein
MNGNDEHLEYISHKGFFHLDCDLTGFTSEEIEIIEKWGNWFTGLTSGELKPFFLRHYKFRYQAIFPFEGV